MQMQSHPPAQYRALLPLASLDEARIMLPLAEKLVDQKEGRLVILRVVTVPEGRPLSDATVNASRSRQALIQFLSEQGYVPAEIKTVVRVSHEVWAGIWETVDQERIDLLILAEDSPGIGETAVGSQMDARLVDPPCAVIAIRPGPDLVESNGWRQIKRILLPVTSNPNTGLSLRIAQALSELGEADITMLHVTSSAPQDIAGDWSAKYTTILQGMDRVRRSITAKGDVSQAIIEEARYHNAVVMGATSCSIDPRNWGGSIQAEVREHTATTIVLVKEASDSVSMGFTDRLKRPVSRERPVSAIVDKWFAENTFHSREFADLDQLLALKMDRGWTISLGLPALNEEETVGNVIQTVKTTLMEEVPLLDEIVLIDSGSVDYTREISSDLGVPVYVHQDILPQYGSYTGKGEALWKSLFVLKGDLIVWIDTDIKNIHPRFVYGVIGPLLRDPRIQYVKGFYRRPLVQGDRLVAGGGGRVTELTTRPFINLFYPELSGLIQPLSGEYAGRRQALEKVPFFTGYGVETGLLIDLLSQFGLQAIAQVDLLERIHHNQRLQSLSKMSFAIMQVVMKRLERRHSVELLDRANLTMNLIRYGPSRFYIDAVEIQERERPPMVDLPEYRQLRGIAPSTSSEFEVVPGEAAHGV